MELAPQFVNASVAVFDREQYAFHRTINGTAAMRSASIVKLLIALKHFRRFPNPTVATRNILRRMLAASDDDIATTYWNLLGQDAVIIETQKRIATQNTHPPSQHGQTAWGYTSTCAVDVVAFYRYLLDEADPAARDFILDCLSMGRGSLRLSSRASHPTVTSSARQGRGQAASTRPGLHHRHHVGPPNCESTREVRPRVATANPDVASAR